MFPQLVMCIMVIVLDGVFFDRAVHLSDLAVRLWMPRSSNRADCKAYARCRCRKHGRLRGWHGPPHDGASRVTLPMFAAHLIALGRLVQRTSRNGSAYVPAGRLVGALRRWRAGDQMVAGVLRNGSPVVSMVCMMTASLRATATAARLKPSRSRSFRPHVRRSDCARLRVSSDVAAS